MLSIEEQNKAFKNQLAREWKVDPHELSYVILKQNLAVLDIPRRTYQFSKYDPNYYKIDSTKLLKIIQNERLNLRDKAFWLPEIQRVTDYVSSLPKKNRKTPNWPFEIYYFPNVRLCKGSPKDYQRSKEKKDKIEKIEQALPEQTKKKPTDILKKVIEEHESDIKKNSNVFLLLGKVWFVKFKNKEWGLYPDLEKYKYIVHLLELTKSASENHEYFIYNSDLISKIKEINDSSENSETVLKEDLNESDLGKELSPEDFKKFKDIGYGLLEELNIAKQAEDSIKQNKAEEVFKTYQSHILNEYGIKSQISDNGLKIHFGTYYRPSKESEKLRQLIKNQINNAIKDFNESMPTLSKHLQSCLKTKLNKTVYTPEKINWQVSL